MPIAYTAIQNSGTVLRSSINTAPRIPATRNTEKIVPARGLIRVVSRTVLFLCCDNFAIVAIFLPAFLIRLISFD